MTYFTLQQLSRANLPTRSFVRYDGPEGHYTVITLPTFVLEVKKNGRSLKVGHPSLEAWVTSTLPEGAADKLYLQTSADYQRGRLTTKLPSDSAAKANEIVRLIKDRPPTDEALLDEIINKLRGAEFR